ncbi:sialomucin core protein 24 [Aplysia californica]|uniref:Sialomucin core protein 24 n=1 Tax=Aplysia californica TaxID=6500 RepID=A0ABM0JMJ6_APLCA|nr:sialomucin core protein 24 [Aplysia californica]
MARFIMSVSILVPFLLAFSLNTKAQVTVGEGDAAPGGATANVTLQDPDPCAAFLFQEECCTNETAQASNCSFCNLTAEGSTQSNCSSSCEASAKDLCLVPEPVVGCSSFNETQACCSANCSFCVTEGGAGVCNDQGTCDDPTSDNCTAPVLTTPASPTEGNTTIVTTTTANSTAETTSTQSTGGDSGGQKFDGASFIGGIILCGGVVALIFFGIKFYKARKEQNYHTL